MFVRTEQVRGERVERGKGSPHRVASLRGRDANANAAATERHAEHTQLPLPRAASYTYLPQAKNRQDGDPAVVELKAHTQYLAARSDDEAADISPHDTTPLDSSGWNTPDEHAPSIPSAEAHEIVAQLQRSAGNTREHRDSSTRSSVSTLESSVRHSGTSLDSTRTISTIATTPASSQRPSLNKSFSRRFSGRWYPSNPSTPSRSPSPTKQDSVAGSIGELPLDEDSTPPASETSRRKSLTLRRRSTKLGKEIKTKKDKGPVFDSGDDQELEESAPTVTRKGTFLRKKATRAACLSKVATNDGTREPLPPPVGSIPAVPGLPKSFSTDRLPTFRTQPSQPERGLPIPKLPSDKHHHISPLSVSKKKDELWSQFRTLDADFTKFSTKSTSLKANVVRNSLIPFLRTYATHASNKMIRPEDLDRRTSILNKWWTGLTELLHGRNNQSISGVDRPVILDGISGIMERPEWRTAPSPFCPLKERTRGSLSNENRSNTSLSTSSSDFLADSVHHNVRNVFVQNLTSQMAFVVDKMSLRNASASLVTFCGKACAYAFMFVPGMADVLVRLWELPVDLMRRVLHENGIGKFDSVPDLTCTSIVANFPPALHSLGFSSMMKYTRKLRTPPPLPLGITNIDWWGSWTQRWSGRESDLFYAFVKYFHILATDFLPPDATKHERICSPGILLVHAQVLSNLDATIHRDANQAQHDATGTITTTFDDLIGDPDAVANTLPIPPTNAVRIMAENRLIMLIRDFLSERSADHPVARDLFAQSFHDLLQAAARGTSMFDHSACYTLLDFLEEALMILIRYESLRTSDEWLLDSDFWHTVCRKMIESENTMTEIRLYAFLFTIWSSIVSDGTRKTNLCIDLLLDPEVFESRFNHWCPMVRAYFMRLLCWRVGRYDGEDGECDDLGLLEIMHVRLQKTWSHYVYLRDQADREQVRQPETNPCHPAPGRRLLIVRTDNVISPGSSFLTFDGFMRDSPMQMAKRNAPSSGALIDSMDPRPESSSSTVDSDNDSNSKGLFGALRKMIGGGSKARSKSQGPSKRSDTPVPMLPVPTDPLGITRSATDDASPAPSSRKSSPTDTPKVPEKPTYRNLSFKFSLEFHVSNKQHLPMRLLPPRLPAPAQRLLELHSKITSPSKINQPVQPQGESIARSRYAGRALAEWTIVVNECQSFFERRLKEGAPARKWVETPTLGVEVFKRPS